MCVFNNVNTHIWLWKYTFLFMSGYGHDESAPTPGGVFRNPFRWCSQRYRNPFAMLLAIRQQHFGNPFAMFWQSVSNVLANRQQCFGKPFAAVGADLSCPHI